MEQSSNVSFATLINSSDSSVPQVPYDDDDVFQCGRCKRQFTSLNLFVHHKRQECSGNISAKVNNGLTNNSKSRPEVSNCFVPSSNQPSLLGEVPREVLTSLPASNFNCSSTFVNTLHSSSSFHLSPSVVIGDETLSFIPVDQNSVFSHLLTEHNGSQVLTVSESDLNTLINSSDRLHLQSVEQDPGQEIFLTAAIISPSGKESNVHIITNVSEPQEDSVTTVEGVRRRDTQSTHEFSDLKSLEVGGNFTRLREENNQQFRLQEDCVHQISKISDEDALLAKSEEIEHADLKGQRPGSQHMTGSMQDKKVERIHKNGKNKNIQTSKVISPPKQQRKCDYCGKLFKKLFNLHQHIRSHTGEKPFHCLVCGRGFTQKSNVKKHMQTHKVWPKIKSTLPKEQISIKVKNDNNQIKEVGSTDESIEYVVNNIYVCQYCDSNFENYHKLKTHLSHVHKHEKLFKCIHKDCMATFLEVEKLISHMKTHEAELEYQCQNCPKKFRTLFDLGAHQYCHRLYPNKMSSCPPKQFRCSKCNSKYASAEALNHHLLTSSHNYPCSLCRLTFVCERYLRRHLRIHGTGEPFKCELCGKMFKTENYLKSHLVIHSDDKPFNCETCGAVFNRRDKLTRHKLMHESRKKFKCPFKNTGCSREFYRKDKLKDHMLSHSRKVYLCGKCGKSFSWPTRLRHHQATFHPEVLANTTCNNCNKIFKTKHHLKIHLCKEPNRAENDDTKIAKDSRVNKRRIIKSRDGCEEQFNLGDDQEIILYTDCDIIEGRINSTEKQDAMLTDLMKAHDTTDREAIVLTKYCETDVPVQIHGETSSKKNNEVLGTLEITFETNVDTPMDPLMAGD